MKQTFRLISSLQLLGKIQLQIIVSASLIMVMGTSIIYPILPLIHNSLDIPKAHIGLILSAFSLPAVFIAPLAGFLADLRGRKSIMMTGLLLYGMAGLGISFVSDFKWLLFLRSLQGAGYSGVMPLVIVLIGDSFTKTQETTAQGMKVFIDRAGTLCFPPLAAVLGLITWRAPFILYALAIPLALCVLLWVPEPDIKKHHRILPYIRDVFSMVRRLYALIIFSMNSLRSFLQVGFFTYLSIFASETLKSGVVKGGLLFTLYAAGAMLTSSQLGLLVERFNPIILVILGFLIQGICLLTVSAVHSILWMGIVMLFFGMANGVISPSQKSLLTQSAPGQLRGGVVSADRVLLNITKTVSPLIAGLILSLGTVETIFHILGAVALVWVVIVLVLYSRGFLQHENDL